MLRREREKRGYDVYRIADHLCIKPGFLVAIENSQYDEFPADAYIIGFLRSYAVHLGLDGKVAIDRYRHEMAGRRKKTVLAMPTPVVEGRTPSAIIIAGALVAAILIYAIWYSISSTNRASVSKPTPLPVSTTAIEPSSRMDSISIPAAPPLATPSAPVAAAAPATPPPAHIAEPQAVTKTVTTETTQKPAAVQTPAPSQPAPPATVAPAPTGISIRAQQPSWVLITDANGKSIIDRVLKAGEVYKVPDGKGLSLTTGNTNGLVLSADGINLPKLPSATDGSRVLRNIPLDAAHLKAMPATQPE